MLEKCVSSRWYRCVPLAWRLERAMEFIEDHLAEPIALKDMAASAGVTRMHFAARFRLAMGTSSHDYLRDRRIERAKSHLLNPGPALVDVVSARQELVMPPVTTVDEAYHFGIFMLRAVMDGRGQQLIDLAKVNLFR